MRLITFILSLWLITVSMAPGGDIAEEDPMVDFLLEYLEIKYRNQSFDRFIYVAAKRQKLFIIKEGKIEKSYTISTAKNGIGTGSGTFCTPMGLHEIAEKVGDGLPVNSIIKNKMPTGSTAKVVKESKTTGQDLITTRVLHLRGLEANINLGGANDSYSRGIFIHGTHEEGLLGTAASKGCVRMSNDEVIELFNSVEVGTFVVILNN